MNKFPYQSGAIFSILSMFLCNPVYAQCSGVDFRGGSLETPRAPNGLQIADFNNDDVPDVVVYLRARVDNSEGAKVLFAFGTGNGSFSSWNAYPILAPHPRGLSIGDLNHDNHLDIAVAGGHGAEVFLGDGQGNFLPAEPININETDISEAIGIEDYDHDGQEELVLAMYPSNEVVLVETTNEAGIESTRSMPCGFNPRRIKFFDLNRDGLLDLFVSGYRSSGIWVWFQQLSGEFTLSRQYADSMNDFTLGDLTGNGLQDLIYTPRDQFDNDIIVRRGRVGPDGFGFEQPRRVYEVAAHALDPITLRAEDVDGDERLDLIVTASDPRFGGLYFMKGLGFGGFESGVLLSSPNLRDRPNTIQIADVDLDGFSDIVGSSTAFDYRVGNQRYGVRVLFDHCPCAADYNGDGALNAFDVLAFTGDFSSHALRSDLNSDSNYNFFDVSAFLQAFNAGCP